MLPRIVSKDKLSNNVLYLNKMLLRFGKIYSPLPSCKMIHKTPLHLLYNSAEMKILWDQLKKNYVHYNIIHFFSYTTEFHPRTY